MEYYYLVTKLGNIITELREFFKGLLATTAFLNKIKFKETLEYLFTCRRGVKFKCGSWGAMT